MSVTLFSSACGWPLCWTWAYVFYSNRREQKVWGLRETTQNNLRTICIKISISTVWLCNFDSMEIACLNFFKEQRACFECISLSTCGGLHCRLRNTSQWALDLKSGLGFVELVYQQLFIPVEKDLWTPEVALCVWSCRTVSAKGFVILSSEKVEKNHSKTQVKETVSCVASGSRSKRSFEKAAVCS